MAAGVAGREYPKLRNLTAREGESAQEIIQRNLAELKGLNEKAVVQFRITSVPGGKAPESYSIVITPSGAHLQTESTAKPNLAVIVSHDTLASIANGSYSPFQAYLDGKLTAIGNVQLAKSIVGKLLPPGVSSNVAVCPTLTNESWTYNGGGLGTIKLTGEYFTPSGDVTIDYNYGSGTYEQIALANSSGSFTTSQNNLFCGPIPGSPYGVIVTATDIATGKYVTQGYATPCG